MASSAKTENLSLNQWEATDPVLREDFNADNCIIDMALKRQCKMFCGRTESCGDLTRSLQNLELDFEPKLVWLWQSGVDAPWYTLFPIMRGTQKVCCAKFGTDDTGTLNTAFSGNNVSWSPVSGMPDAADGTMLNFLVLG